MRASPGLVSVLLPAFNVEPFIAESLGSVLEQSLREIEVIVVDDGSTDRTSSILAEIAARDERVIVVRLGTNGGIVRAMNTGLEMCRAPYIARIDGDDVALPRRLEKQIRFLESHPEISLVGNATITINERGECVGKSPVPVGAKAISACLELSTPIPHIWMARREVYDDLGGYRDLAPAEDYDFLLRAVTAGFRLANLPDHLMCTRIRNDSISDRAALQQRKAQRYIVQLYRERLRRGFDTFSRPRYERAISAGRMESASYKIASFLKRAAFAKPSTARRFCYFALIAVVSPEYARYFFNRLRWRFALKSSGA